MIHCEWRRPLHHDQRLIPIRFFVLGGDYHLRNFRAEDSVTAMRIRGPIAQRVHALPDGSPIRLEID